MVSRDEWLLEPLDDARQITEYPESSEVTEGLTLETAVCRNVCKKIAMASTLFRPEKPFCSSKVTRFVAMSTARGRYQGLGEV